MEPVRYPLLTNTKAAIFIDNQIPHSKSSFIILNCFCFEFAKAYFERCLEKSIDHPNFTAHNYTTTSSFKAANSRAQVSLDIVNSSN